MPKVENHHTARLVTVDTYQDGTLIEGGAIVFLPAELKGEGRSARVVPSKTELSQKKLDACLANRSTRKLFDVGYLKVIDGDQSSKPYPTSGAKLAAQAELERAEFAKKLEEDAQREDAIEAQELKARNEAAEKAAAQKPQGNQNNNQRR